MWFVLLPLLTLMGLATHDDVTKFWFAHPRPGCHWLYRERGALGGMGGFAWPLARTPNVLCWQNNVLTGAGDGR